MSGKYKTNEIYSIKSFFLKTKLTQIKAKWEIYHRLETVNVCQSTGTWFPHQIWSILPHRCHFNVWIWSVGTPHKQKQRLPRTTERLLKKGPSSFDAQGNVKRFSAKIQSFVSQFGATSRWPSQGIHSHTSISVDSRTFAIFFIKNWSESVEP